MYYSLVRFFFFVMLGSSYITQLLLGIFTADLLFDLLLSYINYQQLYKPISPEFQNLYTNKEHTKFLLYHKKKYQFFFFKTFYTLAIFWLAIQYHWLGTLNDFLSGYFTNPFYLASIYFGTLYLLLDFLYWPFSVYNTFHIEQQFDFNTTTPKTFILDRLKTYFLTAIFGLSLLRISYDLIKYFGPNFWIVFWGVMLLFSFLTNFLFTTLILPLFNKLTPLENGKLKQALESYCKDIRFPLQNIYVIDGSKRSTKANAFFSGFFGKKKIVLYDTLIQQYTLEELISIVAHELGHYKLSHIWSNFCLSSLAIFSNLYLLSLCLFNESLSSAVGCSGNYLHINFIVFQILIIPFSKCIDLFMNIFSRKHEYQADEFAVNTTQNKSLKEALIKLCKKNFAQITPHPIFEWFNYSHPSVPKRIAAIEAIQITS